jgi:outer membrane protein assembly factor BamE (lipoprotein component of BamABCDE complex)
MRTAILLTLSAILLSGCANFMSQKMTKLQQGMTTEQVQKILGAPNGLTTSGNVVQYRYDNQLMHSNSWDRADYILEFRDGRLTSWGSTEVRQNRPPMNALLVL